MRKYYSNYTGKQIDEAVSAIIENQISLNDLSPELVATIKGWIAEAGAGEGGVSELVFKTRQEFPSVGDASVLYIATDENQIYFWSNTGYQVLISPTPKEVETRFDAIETTISGLQTQLTNANVLISSNSVRLSSLDNQVAELTRSLNGKADLSTLNLVSNRVDELSALVGTRKASETRSIFGILDADESEIINLKSSTSDLAIKVLNNTSAIADINTKLPAIDSKILTLNSTLKSLETKTVKYEIVPVDGLIVDYRDKEIRLNTERVVPTFQSVGATGNPNMYYVTFKAFAPEGAVKVIEGSNDVMDTEPSELSVDSNGRKYTVIWSAIANYSNGVWSKWGDQSTVNKYLGFFYNFNWLDANGNIISMDKVRVILTNDKCHTDLVPDVIARSIDEKIKAISGIDFSNYYTKDEVNALLTDKDVIGQAVSELGYVNETDAIVLDGGNA